MSFRAVTLQTVELPGRGMPLAEVKPDGEVWLWPAGVGRGTSLTFTAKDWQRIILEVRLAHVRTQKTGMEE